MKTVRITNDSPVSNKAKLMIGNQIVPFYEVDIHLQAGEFATITAKVPIEKIDLKAFEHNTTLNLVRIPLPQLEQPVDNSWSGRGKSWIQKIRNKFKKESV